MGRGPGVHCKVDEWGAAPQGTHPTPYRKIKAFPLWRRADLRPHLWYPSIIPLKPFAGLRTEYSIEQLGRLYDQFFTPHKLSYMHHDVVGGDALKPVYSDTAERKQFQTASIVQGVEFSDLLAEWQELKSVLRVCTSMTTLHDVLMYIELNEEGDTEYPQMRTLLRLLLSAYSTTRHALFSSIS